jgi:hypothetical protein
MIPSVSLLPQYFQKILRHIFSNKVLYYFIDNSRDSENIIFFARYVGIDARPFTEIHGRTLATMERALFILDDTDDIKQKLQKIRGVYKTFPAFLLLIRRPFEANGMDLGGWVDTRLGNLKSMLRDVGSEALIPYDDDCVIAVVKPNLNVGVATYNQYQEKLVLYQKIVELIPRFASILLFQMVESDLHNHIRGNHRMSRVTSSQPFSEENTPSLEGFNYLLILDAPEFMLRSSVINDSGIETILIVRTAPSEIEIKQEIEGFAKDLDHYVAGRRLITLRRTLPKIMVDYPEHLPLAHFHRGLRAEGYKYPMIMDRLVNLTERIQRRDLHLSETMRAVPIVSGSVVDSGALLTVAIYQYLSDETKSGSVQVDLVRRAKSWLVYSKITPATIRWHVSIRYALALMMSQSCYVSNYDYLKLHFEILRLPIADFCVSLHTKYLSSVLILAIALKSRLKVNSALVILRRGLNQFINDSAKLRIDWGVMGFVREVEVAEVGSAWQLAHMVAQEINILVEVSGGAHEKIGICSNSHFGASDLFKLKGDYINLRDQVLRMQSEIDFRKMRYRSLLYKNVIEDLLQKRKEVYVWGDGRASRDFIEFSLNFGLTVSGLIVSDRFYREPCVEKDLPIVKASQINNRCKGGSVVIAHMQSSGSRRWLEETGLFPSEDIYDLDCESLY